MMKSRTLFFIVIGLLILGIALFTYLTQSQQPSQVFPASVNRDCAPWDGAAFTVSIPMSDGASIDISIWQAPDIKFPKTFSFPDNAGQVGNAMVRSANGEYETLSGKVRFESVREGTPVEGRFNFISEGGGKFNGQFKAEWGNVIAMCG